MISVWVNSIYSVIKLNEYRKGFLVSGWGHLCMGIFKCILTGMLQLLTNNNIINNNTTPFRLRFLSQTATAEPGERGRSGAQKGGEYENIYSKVLRWDSLDSLKNLLKFEYIFDKRREARSKPQKKRTRTHAQLARRYLLVLYRAQYSTAVLYCTVVHDSDLTSQNPVNQRRVSRFCTVSTSHT